MNSSSTVLLNSGNRMPVIGLGTWKLTDHTSDAVASALELGYKMIDTSSDYGSQPGVGEGIKMGTDNRENLYIVTKVEETDDAYERTKSNLSELGIDYIDLSLIHRPPVDGAGEELWEGLVQAKDEGLTGDIGVSNYTIDQIEKLIVISGEVPVVNQIEWSPFGHSNEMTNYCRDNGIIIQAYSPLTHGKRLNDKVLNEIAEKYGRTPAQILLKWNLEQGTVPLPKANQKKHQEENIEVFDFDLTNSDIELLNSLNEKYSSLGSLSYI